MLPGHPETIQAAIAAVFGAVEIGAILPVLGGASGAFPFRVLVGTRSYLVRVEGPASPLRNPHQYGAMRMAAEAGIAPRLHYVDEAARVAVMDFIEAQPLSAFPGGAPALARAIGALLARLQATAPFPRFVTYPDIVGRLWAWVCGTGVFAPGVLDPVSAHLERLCAAYRWDEGQTVASHNDPVPRNTLFDGHRLWLIDWESAYRNDPLVDVAIALDSFAPAPELQDILLRSWLGRSPEEGLLNRLAQVRALTHLYYAGVFLSASAAAFGPRADASLATPSASPARESAGRGGPDPETPDAKHNLGKRYLAAFMTASAAPGFALD